MRTAQNITIALAILTVALGGIMVHDVSAAECAPAAGGFVPLECADASDKLSAAYNERDFEKFLQRVFVGAISIGAMLAVLRLAWAGFVYMSSDLWSSKEHAREVIRETLLGLFLLLAIYLILRQINPQILELKVDPPRETVPYTPEDPNMSDFQ